MLEKGCCFVGVTPHDLHGVGLAMKVHDRRHPICIVLKDPFGPHTNATVIEFFRPCGYSRGEYPTAYSPCQLYRKELDFFDHGLGVIDIRDVLNISAVLYEVSGCGEMLCAQSAFGGEP